MKRELYILKLQKDERKKQQETIRKLKKESRRTIKAIRQMFQN